MNSIRGWLLAWLLGTLLLAGLLASALTYFQARDDVDELFDYELQQIAVSLRHQQIRPPAVAEGEDGDEDDEVSDFVVQMWDSKGALLYASHRELTLPRYSGGGLSTVHWQGALWRIYVTTLRGRIIQVAQPMSTRQEMAATVALRILIPVLAMIPILGAVIWLSVGRGLRPLDGIGAALIKRSPGVMDPLPDRGLPREIRPLVRALNDLLRRLEQAMGAQRQFVADAAHELRTPLTAVQVQLQLLERAADRGDREGALTDLKAGVQRAIHLVQQLLALARVEPDGQAEPFQPLSLDDLVRMVVSEYAALALDKDIDLGIGRAERVSLQGAREGLRVLVGNLADNAIRYTPPGGRVDLAIYPERDWAVVQVTDTGPGIPPAERERVFDRFYRKPGSAGQGSGLGLAIAKGIVDRHRGVITLDDGPGGAGLTVTVRLPLSMPRS